MKCRERSLSRFVTGERLKQERRVDFAGAMAFGGPVFVWKLGILSLHDLCYIFAFYNI